MSIEKITITTTEWKDGIRFEREKEISRSDYRGDFDELILDELDSSDVEDFARESLDMIKERNCPKTYVDDFDSEELIEELKERGFDVIECQTLSDSFKLEHLKEKMKIA